MRNGGDVAKAIACGADAVMVGSPLARAYEAPGHGFHWGMATFHPSLPRGARVATVQNGTLEEIIIGPAHENDGTFNLMGGLRTSMATCGYRDIAEFNRAELMIAPSLQTEGKQLQREQQVGMGARGGRGRACRRLSSASEGHGSAVAADQPLEELALEREVATDEVVVLDYGGQYSQLIARRVRECGVFSELLPHHVGVEEVRRRRPKGLILSGGPGVRVRGGRAAARSGAAGARDPGARHLLRHAGARAHARRPGRGRRGGGVRALAADGRRARAGCSPARRAEQSCWMSHRDTVFEAPPGFTRARELDGVAGRGDRGRRARPLRHPVPPRGRPHALRPARPDDVPRGHLRLRAHLEPGLDHRRADRAHPRPGRRRPRHLRPLRRRGLVGRRAARAPRGRRPADVRVRRPRADAQERGRAGDLRLPRPLQGPARRRRRRGPLPRAPAGL